LPIIIQHQRKEIVDKEKFFNFRKDIFDSLFDGFFINKNGIHSGALLRHEYH